VIGVGSSQGGLVFEIRACPGASRRCAGGEHNGALRVQTTAPPEKGKANNDILEILAEALGIRRSRLDIVSGRTSRDKKIRVSGMERDELEKKLSELAGT